MARGIHLFPSRTEKLSLATPMVLRNSGRVGSRRFRKENESRFNKMLSRLFSCYIFTNNSFPLLGDQRKNMRDYKFKHKYCKV